MTNEASAEKTPSVGALLRASRLRCGEDLHHVAGVLYIRYSYLNSIEEGRYQDLPGSTYAVGFIRTYAEHLGLDATEIVRRFKIETSGLGDAKELVFPTPLSEGGVPGGAVLFIGLVIASLAYGGWYIGTTRDRFDFDLIPAMPERLAGLFGGGSKADHGDGMPVVDAVASDKLRDETQVGAEAAVVEAARRSESGAPEVKPDDRSVSEPTVTEPAPAVVAQTAPRQRPPSALSEPLGESEPVVSPASGSTVAVLPEAVPPAPSLPASPPSQNLPVGELAAKIPVADSPRPAAPEPASVRPSEVDSTATAPAIPSSEASPLPPPAPSVSAEQPVAVAEDTAEEDESPDQFVAPTGDLQSAEATPGEPTGRPEDSGRIVVRAKDAASWIQIRDDVAKQLLLTRLLRPGESYRVPDRPGLKLLTGNAGALAVLVDGKAVPPIGPVGAVRRDVALEVDKLLSGAANEN